MLHAASIPRRVESRDFSHFFWRERGELRHGWGAGRVPLRATLEFLIEVDVRRPSPDWEESLGRKRAGAAVGGGRGGDGGLAAAGGVEGRRTEGYIRRRLGGELDVGEGALRLVEVARGCGKR